MRPHPDTDELALAALGEDVLSPDAQAHVAGCSRCSRTVAELTDTVRVARGPRTDDVTSVPVPAHVWRGIAEELGVHRSVRPASVGPSAVRTTGVPATEGPARTAAEVADPVPAPAADPAVVPRPGPSAPGHDELHARRARRGVPVRLLGVAAAGLVVGAAGTAAVVSWSSGDAEAPPVAAPSPAVVAATDLLAFGAGEGTGVSGAARLAVLGEVDAGPDADRVLQVELEALPDTGEDFLEAWLIDADSGTMVSLGTVPSGDAGATAQLAVPRGLDLGTYDLVDVSAEPLDGDPTHSGASLVRGTLVT